MVVAPRWASRKAALLGSAWVSLADPAQNTSFTLDSYLHHAAAIYEMTRFRASGSRFQNLTHVRQLPFDWRGFVGSLRDAAREALGECDILSFAIKTREGCTSQDGGTLVDFVAVRSDGICVRMT